MGRRSRLARGDGLHGRLGVGLWAESCCGRRGGFVLYLGREGLESVAMEHAGGVIGDQI